MNYVFFVIITLFIFSESEAMLLKGNIKKLSSNIIKKKIVKNNLKRNFFWKTKPVKKRGFKDLKGEIPKPITDLTDMIKNSEKYKKMGAKLPKGILMVGPPGTGKTSIARAVAYEANVPFDNICASSFHKSYVGQAQENVAEIFRNIREKGKSHKSCKSILFIDEIDSVGTRQNNSPNNFSSRELLPALLNQMDGFEENDALTVIGATNSPVDLDPALKRPGRFDRIIEIPLPDIKSRKELLIFFLSKVIYNKDEITENYIEDLAYITEGFSHADLKHLINEAAILAVRSNADEINKEHIWQSLEEIEKRQRASLQKI